MNRNLLYLVNPISGTRKKPVLLEAIHALTLAKGFSYAVADTHRDGNYTHLRTRIITEGITDLIICGGDGTVSQVCSHLMGLDINIGIVPMGSGNGLAFAAGIPLSVSKALSIIFQGHAEWIDGFMINEKFSCMMCGIGSDAQVAHDFAVQKTRGLRTYLRLSALHYFKSKPFAFSITTDERSFDTDAFFIVVANSNQFGNNVTIAPKASLQDGLLDIVVVRKMHKLVLPFALLHQIAGINTLEEIKTYRRMRNILYFQSANLVINNHGNAPIHIDGEPESTAAEVKIRILPKAVRLLQPLLPGRHPGR